MSNLLRNSSKRIVTTTLLRRCPNANRKCPQIVQIWKLQQPFECELNFK
jgi:hypothetical protein